MAPKFWSNRWLRGKKQVVTNLSFPRWRVFIGQRSSKASRQPTLMILKSKWQFRLRQFSASMDLQLLSKI
jgi:hypothetical protein